MYKLSLSSKGDSKAIAKIVGGKNKNKLVYLTKENTDNKLNGKLDYDLLEDTMKEMKIKLRERLGLLMKIEELFESGKKPEDVVSDDKRIVELYKTLFGHSENETFLKADFGSSFEIMPNQDENKTSRYYIAGMTESGKSYVAKTIINNYHSTFPERKVYCISKLKSDETLDSCDVELIRINPETFLEDPPTLEEFEDDGNGCLIVFDDYDGFKGKLGNILQTFIDDTVQMGRHHNISCILCTHHLTNYKTSAIKLSECNYYVIFPHGSTSKKLSYLLDSYAGIDEKNIKMIKKMGRWILVSRTYPQYVIGEKEVRIINDE
jgi:hypothetical protein